MLDLTWLTPTLAVGGHIWPGEWSDLARSGVSAVVDCRDKACDPANVLQSVGMTFLHLPTPDAYGFPLAKLKQGIAWIEEQQCLGRRVLVHCQAGRGRSVVLTAATLIAQGFSADCSLEIIKQKRPIISPTAIQLAQLRQFAASRDGGSNLAPGRLQQSGTERR